MSIHMITDKEENQKKVREAQRIIFNLDIIGSVQYWHDLTTLTDIQKEREV